MKNIGKILAFFAAVAAIAAAVYVVLHNWEKIVTFCKAHCPFCKEAPAEFDDYVE